MTVLDEITFERQGQIEREGWSLERDDGHNEGEIAMAAALYATPTPLVELNVHKKAITWVDPWPSRQFVPTGRPAGEDGGYSIPNGGLQHESSSAHGPTENLSQRSVMSGS